MGYEPKHKKAPDEKELKRLVLLTTILNLFTALLNLIKALL